MSKKARKALIKVHNGALLMKDSKNQEEIFTRTSKMIF